MDALTQQGVDAIRAGNKSAAKQLLKYAIQQDTKNIDAWIWLSATMETDQERFNCLEQAIKIDPNNQTAARGIAQLIAQGKVKLQAENNNLNTLRDFTKETNANTSRPLPPQPVASKKSENEKTIFELHPSGLPYCLVIIDLFLITALLISILKPIAPSLVFLTGIFFVLALLIIILIAGLKLRSTRYVLTTRHLTVYNGILNRKKKMIPVEKIQDVSIDQKFIFRIFKVGNIILESAGDASGVTLYYVKNCERYSQLILKASRSNS